MKNIAKVLFSLVLFASFSSSIFSQGFEISLGGENGDDVARCVIPISTGGYLVSGTICEGYENDAVIIKIAEDGSVTWQTRVDGLTSTTSADQLRSVIETSDGGFVGTGVIQNSMFASSEDLLIARFDSEGTFQWKKVYDFKGYDFGNCIRECADGSFIIAGGLKTLSSENEFFVMKTDANGDSLWTVRIDGEYEDRAHSVVVLDDGNYIVSGYTQSLGGYGYHLLLAKIDPDGNVLWEKYLQGDAGNCIKKTSDDGFVIAVPRGVTKTDIDGNIIWQTKIDQDDGSEFRSVIELTGGGYIATGFVNEFTEEANQQMIIAKLDNSGSLVWKNRYGRNEFNKNDEGYSIIETSDGGCLSVGFTCTDKETNWGTISHLDIYLVKTDASGITAVENDFSLIPENFEMSQNYPNPFNPQTTIEFSMSKREQVEIKIYNLLGKEIKTLINEVKPAGKHKVIWDGTNKDDRKVASGVYLYKIKTKSYTHTKKMVLIK